MQESQVKWNEKQRGNLLAAVYGNAAHMRQTHCAQICHVQTP